MQLSNKKSLTEECTSFRLTLAEITNAQFNWHVLCLTETQTGSFITGVFAVNEKCYP